MLNSLRLLIALLTLDLVLVCGWVLYRLNGGPGVFSPSEVTPPLVAAGVLVALVTLFLTRQRNQSEDYLENALDILEKAYDRLAVLDEHGRPLNKRLNWLTAARLIRTAQAIARKIDEESHREIWKEHLNFWRGRFYDLIFPNLEGFPSDYYAEKPEHMLAYSGDTRDPLAMSSLAVLYRFIRWPKDVEDPIKGEEPFSEKEINKMVSFGPRGLGNLLSAVERLKERSRQAAAQQQVPADAPASRRPRR